jgi:hypothetical protein
MKRFSAGLLNEDSERKRRNTLAAPRGGVAGEPASTA